jgi:hypothetical protein
MMLVGYVLVLSASVPGKCHTGVLLSEHDSVG